MWLHASCLSLVLFAGLCRGLAPAAEPAVQAGRLKVGIRPWLTMKGSIRDPEFPAPAP